jgi:GDPmannose 4,6-dehydratase
VQAQWLMLQQSQAEDFVIASGEQHSVREFVELAASKMGMRIEWTGRGVAEVGTDALSGKAVIRIDQRYFRPTEVDALLGDPRKAQDKLGWRARIGFDALVQEMVDADLSAARRDALVAKEGFRVYNHHE